MNSFAFLYCCFYRWSERVNGKTYPHAYSASIMMSFMLMLVGGAFFSVLVVLSNLDIQSFSYWQITVGLFAVIVFLTVRGYFTSGDKYLKLLQAFDSSNSRFRKKPGVIVVLSLGVSILFLFSVWALMFSLRG